MDPLGLSILLLLIFSLILILFFTSYDQPRDEYDYIFTLHQEEPILDKKGDQIRFKGDLHLHNKKVGTVFGVTDLVGRISCDKYMRSRKLYFDMFDGTLIAEGLSNNYGLDGLLKDSHETTIIGGSGRYQGMVGKIHTTRSVSKNEYKHVVHLRY
jgi:hypothetical protein